MSNDFTTWFIIGFLSLLAYMWYDGQNSEVKYVISTFDNQRYLVQNRDDALEAANLLAQTKRSLVGLCDQLKGKWNGSDEKSKGVNRLLKKFNPDSLSETGKGSKYTSYSVNKGEKIVLCLRSRDEKDTLVDPNTLMFVALHELAHVMTKSVGHTTEFWSNFKFLLQHAIELGIYRGIDYGKNPQPYCGIVVTDTPLTDKSL